MKIIDFILCDDIRNEMANKISVIGAYNDRIEFISPPEQELKWPMNIRLAFYCRLMNDDNLTFDALELSMHLEGEEILNFQANMLEGSDLSRPLVLAFPIPGIKISGPGELISTIKVLSGKNIIQEIKPECKFKISVRNT